MSKPRSAENSDLIDGRHPRSAPIVKRFCDSPHTPAEGHQFDALFATASIGSVTFDDDGAIGNRCFIFPATLAQTCGSLC